MKVAIRENAAGIMAMACAMLVWAAVAFDAVRALELPAPGPVIETR